jgi:hypothetical protein
MPVARRMIAKVQDPEDYDTIPAFATSLRTNTMYRFIVEDLCNTPGFVVKESIMREDKTGQYFISQVVFEDWETFNAYMLREEIDSIWDYLRVTAETYNIEWEVKDEEITRNVEWEKRIVED